MLLIQLTNDQPTVLVRKFRQHHQAMVSGPATMYCHLQDSCRRGVVSTGGHVLFNKNDLWFVHLNSLLFSPTLLMNYEIFS